MAPDSVPEIPGMGEGIQLIMSQLAQGYCPLQSKGCARMNDLEAAVKAQKETQDKHTDMLGRIETKLDHGQKEFADLNRYIEGNGQPGMVERLTRVETRYVLLWVLMVGAVATGLGALLVELVKG